MGRLKVIRHPTVSATALAFEFDADGTSFLVSNYTEGDIYVATEAGAAKDESILVPADCARVINCVQEEGSRAGTGTIQVIPDATSEKGVEVQCLKW